MNWITIKNVHFNLDQVQAITWGDGYLRILTVGREPDIIKDPDRRWYEHICNRVSLLPVEQEEEK